MQCRKRCRKNPNNYYEVEAKEKSYKCRGEKCMYFPHQHNETTTPKYVCSTSGHSITELQTEHTAKLDKHSHTSCTRREDQLTYLKSRGGIIIYDHNM